MKSVNLAFKLPSHLQWIDNGTYVADRTTIDSITTNSTNFTSLLMLLISKADTSNIKKLYNEFPEETVSYLFYTNDNKFYNAMRDDPDVVIIQVKS